MRCFLTCQSHPHPTDITRCPQSDIAQLGSVGLCAGRSTAALTALRLELPLRGLEGLREECQGRTELGMDGSEGRNRH